MKPLRLLNTLFNRRNSPEKIRLLNNDYQYNNLCTKNSKQIIEISERAWNKIDNIIGNYKSKKKQASMLLSISGGGCNGFKYIFTLNTDIKLEDEKYSYVENNEKNKVYIDPIGELYLIGTKIDYVKEDISKNIFESKFIFTPDKSMATNCGCGTSFSPIEPKMDKL